MQENPKKTHESLYKWYCKQASVRTGDEYNIGKDNGGKEALEALYASLYGKEEMERLRQECSHDKK